jgi:hypothetical protein
LKEETAKYPEFQEFDEPSSTPADGRSTAAVSSVGTPLASNGTNGPKLRLTMNGNGNGHGNGNGNGGHDVYTNGGDSAMQSDDE